MTDPDRDTAEERRMPIESEKHLAGEHRSHTSDPPGPSSDQAQVELREEELIAKKRTLQAGAVRLDTEVVSEQRTIDVPVTREEVYVERHAIERRPADAPIGESGEAIAVPVHEEEVVVEKRPVVYEEVDLSKRSVRDRRLLSDTVRKEVVDVDAEGAVPTDADPRSQPRRQAAGDP